MFSSEKHHSVLRTRKLRIGKLSLCSKQGHCPQQFADFAASAEAVQVRTGSRYFRGRGHGVSPPRNRSPKRGRAFPEARLAFGEEAAEAEKVPERQAEQQPSLKVTQR